jgi:dual 3',5'-cyclic-AMP and -GMP phosphodiesterase 11
VVHDLFEEQTSLEKVTLKIMQRAQRLLKCERAAVLLLDENADGVKFSKLFELTKPAHSTNQKRYSPLNCVIIISARKQSPAFFMFC